MAEPDSGAVLLQTVYAKQYITHLHRLIIRFCIAKSIS